MNKILLIFNTLILFALFLIELNLEDIRFLFRRKTKLFFTTHFFVGRR